MQENGEKMGINIGVFGWECLYGEEMKMIAKLEEGMDMVQLIEKVVFSIIM